MTTLETLTRRVQEALLATSKTIATAESCTGGMVAALLTELAGASAWFLCGFVTYANAAKENCLGVPAALIAQEGAVSEQVARKMAEGALLQSGASLALAITGIAGPSGGSVEKPVGTVCFAWALQNEASTSATMRFLGDRQKVREQAVVYALEGVLNRLYSK